MDKIEFAEWIKREVMRSNKYWNSNISLRHDWLGPMFDRATTKSLMKEITWKEEDIAA